MGQDEGSGGRLAALAGAAPAVGHQALTEEEQALLASLDGEGLAPIAAESVAAIYMCPSRLVPWEKNPRINDPSVMKVAKSIDSLFFGAPIVVQRSTLMIMAGHTRWKASMYLKLDRVPVRLIDCDDDKARAYAIVDNKLGEDAVWDIDLLNAELLKLRDVIDDFGLGLQDMGFDAEYIAELDAMQADAFAELEASLEPEEDAAPSASPDHPGDDEIPEVVEDAPPKTQAGEVVRLGPHVLHVSDCIEVMDKLEANSIDAMVSDPPYGLSLDGQCRTWDDIEAMQAAGRGVSKGFMGEVWDAGVPGLKWAQSVYRVMKPGAWGVAFSSTRTLHRLASALEDAGFLIRDTLHWANWAGFPKSAAVDLSIDRLLGVEDQRPVVCVSRAQVGANAYNQGEGVWKGNAKRTLPASEEAAAWQGWGTNLKPAVEPAVLFRKPFDKDSETVAKNVMKWGTGGINIDACRIPFGDPRWPGPSAMRRREASGSETMNVSIEEARTAKNVEAWKPHPLGGWPANLIVVPKVQKPERHEGFEDGRRNNHPTPKPVALMRWLCRLLCPPGGTILEPFGGSGTTIVAAQREGFKVVAAEISPKYADIIRVRVNHVLQIGGGEE